MYNNEEGKCNERQPTPRNNVNAKHIQAEEGDNAFVEVQEQLLSASVRPDGGGNSVPSCQSCVSLGCRIDYS